MAIKLGSGRDRKPPSGHAGNRIGILTVVGGLFAFLVLLCCGGGVLLSLLEPSPRIASDVMDAAPSNEPDDTPVPEQNAADLLLPDHSPPPDLALPPIEDLAAGAPAPDQAVENAKPETESTPSKPVFRPRTWTTLVGAHTVLAELVQFNETHVQLKRDGTGKLLSIPLEKLSATDNEYVEQIRGSPTVHHDGATLLVGKVTRILDGDTVKFRELGGDEITVRLDGVDAPEKDQRFGDDATRWLAHQLSGKIVRVETTGTDRYGRSLGHLYVADHWLNRELVVVGFAWHYIKYNKDTELAEAQHVAQRSASGLWVDARRVAPWDYRNGQRIETTLPANVPSTRADDPVVYITDTGEKYHRLNCRYLDESQHAIPLSRATSAYEACKVCKP